MYVYVGKYASYIYQLTTYILIKMANELGKCGGGGGAACIRKQKQQKSSNGCSIQR